MIRIINLRVAVTVKATIEEIVEKKYPQLKGYIQKIHVVRRAVDARKKPNIVFVYTLFVEAQHEEKIIKKLGNQRMLPYLHLRIQNRLPLVIDL